MDSPSQNTTSRPVKNSDPATLLGAWWSAADQSMALAGLLRHGLPTGLPGSPKHEQSTRASPEPRRRLNGSQTSSKMMLPPTAHLRATKHLETRLDLLGSSIKEKGTGTSVKVPPSLPPHFLPRLGSAELTISSVGDSRERPNLMLCSTRDGMETPPSVVPSKRGWRTSRRDFPSLSLQQSSDSTPGRQQELVDGGRLSPPVSFFPSPAHSAPGYAVPSGKPISRLELSPEGTAPLDLCLKKGASTTFLSPEVTLTPVMSSKPPSAPRIATGTSTPVARLHQMHILETLTANLEQPKSVDLHSPSRRKGRKSRDSLLPSPAVLGSLFAALGAQDMKLSPKEQESLHRFQLLASQGYKSKNSMVHKLANSMFLNEAPAGPNRLLASGEEEQAARTSPNIGSTNRKRASPEQSDSRPRDTMQRNRRAELDNGVSDSDSSSESESGGDFQSVSGNSDMEDIEITGAASTSRNILATSERRPKRSKDGFERSPKRRRYQRGDRELRAPLNRGWRRETKIRCFSKSGIRGEVYYIAPCGKKLKSYPEVMRYLQKNSITDIGRENFSFSTKVNVGDFLEDAANGSGPGGCLVLSGEEMLSRLQKTQELQHSSAGLGIVRRGRPRTGTPDSQSQDHDMPQAEETWWYQERLEQLEKQHIEKELRTQQIIEIRHQRQEELEGQRQEDAMRRTQELQKRREMLLMVDLERERRRQHMLLVRALENRKKYEDQKRMDLQILKEVRRPVEDMRLKDTLPLPILNRIPGLKIPGTAFANLLMVQEFLHNFGEALHFDVEKIPSLNTLQLALINHDRKSEKEFLSLVQHLLVCAIHDPGTPHCKEAVTVLGQHVKDALITSDSITEAFHLYFMALDKECAMYQWVTEKPFLALNPTQKSEIMAFLCNELLCSRAVVRQVDSSIDAVNTLRKDKWLAEGELRKLRGIQQARQRKALLRQDQEETKPSENAVSKESLGRDGDKEIVKGPKTDDDDDNEDGGNESANDSDDLPDAENDMDEEDGEPNLSNEDLEKRIEKLAKQQAQFQSKVAKTVSTIRASMLGQDRFRRRYWLLPVTGGVFVEAMESGEQDGMGDFSAADYVIDENDNDDSHKCKFKKEQKVEVKEEGETESGLKQEENVDHEMDGCMVELSNLSNLGEESEVVKKEMIQVRKDEDKMSEDPEVGEESNQMENEMVYTNEEMQVHEGRKVKAPVMSEPNTEQAWMLQSPFLASVMAGNVLFVQGGKEGGDALNSASLMAEQMIKTLAQQKRPWFSILPRVPCDEDSMARLPVKNVEEENDIEDEGGSHHGSGCFSVVETEDTTNQHDKPQPVPTELLRGWWRITDAAQLHSVMAGLHANGIREKALLKQLEKSFNCGAVSTIPNSQQDLGLEITERDREVSEKHGGAVPPDYEDQWYPEVALRVDVTLLEQVENMEQKVVGASMQTKGWRPPPKASNDPTKEFRPSCVLLHKRLLSSSEDNEDSLDNSPSASISEETESTVKAEAAMVSGVNMQAFTAPENEKLKCAKKENTSADVSEEPSQSRDTEEPNREEKEAQKRAAGTAVAENSINPIEIAKKRLLWLEAAIERRYLRPPLGVSGNSVLPVQPGVGATGRSKWEEEGSKEEEMPPGLVRWRQAVEACQTAAQLAMCLAHLDKSIAWDRSIMKASCQFCHNGDNEEMLLLCDGCDKGYHTYCFKPKMENIPEGDWFCYECLNKSQEEKVCVLCGRKGKLIHCEGCPKVFHMACLEPPLMKPPKGKWACSSCSKLTRKKGRPSKEQKETKDQQICETKDKEVTSKKAESPSPVKTKITERREKNKSQPVKDLAACRMILDEMEKHKDCWPFLLPVNTKQFPSYRKFIKKPMDVSTMRSKLESGQYKAKDEFACDARLIFDNCETFNEDDSPVGQAGHSMRNFFECRWDELNS